MATIRRNRLCRAFRTDCTVKVCCNPYHRDRFIHQSRISALYSANEWEITHFYAHRYDLASAVRLTVDALRDGRNLSILRLSR